MTRQYTAEQIAEIVAQREELRSVLFGIRPLVAYLAKEEGKWTPYGGFYQGLLAAADAAIARAGAA